MSPASIGGYEAGSLYGEERRVTTTGASVREPGADVTPTGNELAQIDAAAAMTE